ncbi:NB-ARC domain-containing protein [Streptomyces lunalinharesii]|uniref:WD40 repeat-containing protein SMU1 n=1 Tax=Streptomyces lunalinharesii TaxID=333384 RepID=A0ABP6E1M8_9ACTN
MLARSRHAAAPSLERYARPGVDAIAHVGGGNFSTGVLLEFDEQVINGGAQVRNWKMGLALLAGLGAAVSLFLALAANPATSKERWPGPLDWLRQHPWLWVGVLGGLAVVVAVALTWWQSSPPAAVNDPSPPPPPVVPAWFVDRHQTREAVDEVCRGAGEVGITTSLSGAGGFGKTTLAIAVANHRRVRRQFQSRIYTVTIGRDVRGRSAVAAKVAQATKFITGDTTEFDDPHTAGAHLGRLLDERPRTLLVLDDVWEEEQLAPFLLGGSPCVRLVTTRNPKLLPPTARSIQVDQMSHTQSKAVLTHELPPLREDLVDGLLRVTGRWALLLRLTNRSIVLQTETGADPAAAAGQVLEQLRNLGPKAAANPTADPTTWDLDDPDQRNQAVQASIEAATTLLPPGGAARFTELGIFAEDEDIPVSVVAQLWQATDGLTEHQARVLLAQLHRLSLINLDNTRDGGRISLHDVVRDYLRSELGTANLTRFNGLLIDAIATTLPPAQPLATTAPDPRYAWWQLEVGYLLDHLIDHLLAAGRISSAEAVAGDVRWVEARLHQRGPTAPWTDLARINTAHTRRLARNLLQTAHLLSPTDSPHALVGILHNRLEAHPHWQSQITARRHGAALRPYLANQWPPPDTPNPALQRTLTTPRLDRVLSVAIAPDGTWLAAASADGTVRIWDPASGTCTTTLTGPANLASSVTIASDGTWLAAASADGTVCIWDAVSGTCTATHIGHGSVVSSVAIAPDGTWFAAASSDGRVWIWDPVSGARIITITGHTSVVSSVAIAPDGTWLATVGDDGTVWIWDRDSGTCTTMLTGHGSAVSSVAIAPDGTWLATVGDDATVWIWDPVSVTCTATLTGHSIAVNSVAIAPDGTWLATIGYDATVGIWDLASGTCTATLTGHTDWVTSAAIASDGTWLATASNDGTVRIWDMNSDIETFAHTSNIPPVFSAAIAPDGTWLATASSDGTVGIWDLASGARTTTLTGHTSRVSSVAIAPDGTWLATASSDGTVGIWDPVSGTCTTMLTGHGSAVYSVAIAPDGTWLATASSDGTAGIWDLASGARTTTLTGHTSRVSSVAIAPDGTWLATTSNDKIVRIWDLASGTCTTTLTGHTGAVSSVAIAPDGTWLATTSEDGTVRIWNPVTTVTTALTGHSNGVSSVAIAPDSAWFATTGFDGTVQVWDAREQRTVAIARTDGNLYSCAWTSGHELAVGGQQGIYLFAFRA